MADNDLLDFVAEDVLQSLGKRLVLLLLGLTLLLLIVGLFQLEVLSDVTNFLLLNSLSWVMAYSSIDSPVM